MRERKDCKRSGSFVEAPSSADGYIGLFCFTRRGHEKMVSGVAHLGEIATMLRKILACSARTEEGTKKWCMKWVSYEWLQYIRINYFWNEYILLFYILGCN